MLKERAYVLLPFLLVFFLSSLVAAQSFEQWAIEVEGSSQYGTGDWSFGQLKGKPDAYPQYGDHSKAWAPRTQDGGQEWLELVYAEAVIVEKIDIYENYNPGAIIKVELKDESGRSYMVWSGVAKPALPEARIFTITNSDIKVPVKRLRITLDTSKVPGWNEIDAVSILGKRVDGTQLGTGFSNYVDQWVFSAFASSEYQQDSWAAKQVIGEPDVFPEYGDSSKAWTPKTRDGGVEWIELSYAEAVYVDRINVYETYHPGAISKVELVDQDGLGYIIWQGVPQVATEKSRIFSIKNTSVRKPVRKVVLTLQTDQVAGWNEIDAVQLLGWRNYAQGDSVSQVPPSIVALEGQLARLLDRARRENLAEPGFLDELELFLKALFQLL